MGRITLFDKEFTRILFIVSVALVVIPFSWVGFLASDDDLYLSYALRWLDDPPVLPNTHWGFRHTVVFPLSVAVGLFGQSEYTLALPSLVYMGILTAGIYMVVRQAFGPVPAAVTAVLLITTPLFSVASSIANADIPETLYCMASLAFLHRAIGRQPRDPSGRDWLVLLILSGTCAGLAFVTRETAAGVGLYIAILFLLGAWMKRVRYLWIAAGFWLIVGIEWLFYVYMGEGLLYRLYTITSTHGSVGLRGGEFEAGTGNVSNNRVIGPFLALLVNQEFGLLFYFAVPAGIGLWRGRTLTADQRVFVRLVIGFVIVWFVWISFAGAVRPLPRYYAPMAASCAILIGIWLCSLASVKLAALSGILIIGMNFAGLSLENRYPRFGAGVYSKLVAQSAEPVYTDERTRGRASRMLKWEGADLGLARETRPPAGALYFYNPATLDGKKPGPDIRQGVAGKAGWTVVMSERPPKRHIGKALSFLGLDGFLPDSIRYRLVFGSDEVTLFRLPPQDNQ